MESRPRRALLWTAIIIASGVILRRAPLHLPTLLTKYGGSLLWGAMFYALCVAIGPRQRPVTIGIAAALFTLATELLELAHTPPVEAFRSTPIGHLLVGTYFSYLDILAYWTAIVLVAMVDSRKLRQADRPHHEPVP